MTVTVPGPIRRRAAGSPGLRRVRRTVLVPYPVMRHCGGTRPRPAAAAPGGGARRPLPGRRRRGHRLRTVAAVPLSHMITVIGRSQHSLEVQHWASDVDLILHIELRNFGAGKVIIGPHDARQWQPPGPGPVSGNGHRTLAVNESLNRSSPDENQSVGI